VNTPEVPTSREERDTDQSKNAREREATAQSERRALGWLAFVAAGLICWVAAPVGVGILFGTLIAFTLQPLYERWKPALGRWTAMATTVLATVSLLAAFGGLGWLFVAKGSALARKSIAELLPAVGGPIDALGRLTSRVGLPPQELAQRLRAAAEGLAARAAGIAETIVATTATSLLSLFFAMLTVHFILQNWQGLALRAQEILPIRPDYTRELFEEFRRVGRTTLLGTILTGLAQGVFATVGYAVTGVPEPLFFGAATAVASLIPAVGTLLIWVPVGVGLIVTGHTIAGIVELVWSALTVGAISDYVIRPLLVGGEGAVPTLVTFMALFGGVEVFGLKGLILGPVVVSLAIAALRLYAKEARALRASMTSDKRQGTETPAREYRR
jgi:predicted PurR-regulated permease PerM